MDVKIVPRDHRRSIRQTAVAITVVSWFIMIAFAVSNGESLRRAMAIAAVQVAGGLAAWTCYHLIGNQNNGLITIGMAAQPFTYRPDLSLHRELANRALTGLAIVLLHCIFGMIMRATRKSKKSTVNPPLWDDQMDRNPAGLPSS